MARTCCASSAPRTLSTIEAVASALSRVNSTRSGSTRWTRAACTRSIALMVRASSPSSARRWLMFCTKLVAPSASDLSNSSYPHPAAAREAGFGELHAQPRHPVLRHQDDGAVVLHLERDALPLQVLHDRRGILEAQIGEQRGHLRRGDAQDQEGEEADQQRRDRGHRRQPRRSQRPQERDYPLHLLRPDRITRHFPTRQNLPGSWLLAG